MAALQHTACQCGTSDDQEGYGWCQRSGMGDSGQHFVGGASQALSLHGQVTFQYQFVQAAAVKS